jgi:hypothetical protein
VPLTPANFMAIAHRGASAYAPELPTGWLVSEVSDAMLARARELGLTQICPKAEHVTPALVRRLPSADIRIMGVSSRL